MAKLESTLLNMTLSLCLVALIAAIALGGGYVFTKDRIAKGEEKTKVDAIRKVAPEFNNNPIEELYVYQLNRATKDSTSVIVYPAKFNGKLVGAAVESTSHKGYSGEVKIMCGFDADGTVRGFQVVKHTETAGLGAKMQSWFSTDKNNQSVIGLNPATTNMKVKKDGGEIDAITAATISSRAFLEALNGAFEAYKVYEQEREGGSSK